MIHRSNLRSTPGIICIVINVDRLIYKPGYGQVIMGKMQPGFKIEKISDLAFKSTLIALIVVVLLIVFKLIMTGQFTISFWANSWLMVSLIVVLISNSIAQNLEKKIGSLGLRCGDCHATYAHKSKFFTDLDANPMNKTILLVPKPRNKVYWIKR